jgi:hypothetical protein
VGLTNSAVAAVAATAAAAAAAVGASEQQRFAILPTDLVLKTAIASETTQMWMRLKSNQFEGNTKSA